jgi:thioredoxin 1
MSQTSLILTLVLIYAQGSEPFMPKKTSQQLLRRNKKYVVSLAGSLNVVELGNNNFRQLFHGEKPVLIDACAKWCGPCKLIEPTIHRCADNRIDSLQVCRYDVESDSNEVKLELLIKGAMPKALPSLILVKNNKVLAARSGLITDKELDEFLDQNLSKANDDSKNSKQEEEEIVEKTKRTQKKGFINFLDQQVGDYMLTENF